MPDDAPAAPAAQGEQVADAVDYLRSELKALRDQTRPRRGGWLNIDTAAVQFAFDGNLRHAQAFWIRLQDQSMWTAKIGFDGRGGAIRLESDGRYKVVVLPRFVGRKKTPAGHWIPIPRRAKSLTLGDCGKAQVKIPLDSDGGMLALIPYRNSLIVGL